MTGTSEVRVMSKEEFDALGWVEVDRELERHSRWSLEYRVVSKDEDGRFWEWGQEVPATEHQEVETLDWLSLVEVFPVEKTVTVYE